MKKINKIVNIISEILFGIISGALIVFTGYEVYCKEYLPAIIFLVLAILWNPIVLDKIFKKIGGKPDYLYLVTVLYASTGWFVACKISMIFGEDYVSVLQISMYIIYILFLVMTKSWDKDIKYRIFGFVYLASVLLGYMSEKMTEGLIGFLNFIHFTAEDIDGNTFALFFQGVLQPVKEAILTYIIFDTVIEKTKQGVEKHKGEQLMDKIKGDIEDYKEKQNHIVLDDNKIILENITANIELETKDISVSIKKK